MFSFALAESEIVAPNLDFQWIAQRSGPNQGDPGASENAHLTESDKGGSCAGKFPDDGRSADGEVGKFNGREHQPSSSADLLDENTFGGGMAERQPCPIYLTQDGSVAGYFGHEC